MTVRGVTEPQAAALALAARLAELLRQLRLPAIDAFMADWPPALEAVRPNAANHVPALRWLEALGAAAPAFATRFVSLLAVECAQLPWRQTYSAQEAGSGFMDAYGYCEIIGTTAAVRSTRLAAGVLLLGPHTRYPAHRHEAEEIYVPLVGAAHWWQGVRPWQRRLPGELIHHARFEPHAMSTGEAPLLALYLWRSEHLTQKAQLISGTLPVDVPIPGRLSR